MTKSGIFFPKQSQKTYLDGPFCKFVANCQGIRLGKVAKRLGVSQASLSRYLSGAIPVDHATVKNLAEILDVPQPSRLISNRYVSLEGRKS